MQKKPIAPILQVLLAAALFGVSAPLAKTLLANADPVPLAGFLYLGCGLGALGLLGAQHVQNPGRSVEAHLARGEVPWLLGAILAGGVAAPIVLLASLRATPASTASLLLNFESVATALIAVFLFRESVGGRTGWAVAAITLAGLLLSWEGGNAWGFSLGALGILAACFLWGLDNNFTRHISAKDPLAIVAVKGLGAGAFSILLALGLGKTLPAAATALWAMLLGAVSYGASLQLFVLGMRELGAARSSALFGIAPFVGAVFSVILFHETPPVLFWAAVPFMLAGAWLMLSEKHGHLHSHEMFEHAHRHVHDEHHRHESPEPGAHAHVHRHDALGHEHEHTPDLHHRH